MKFTWEDFKSALRDADMTQADFARLIERHVTTVNAWKRNKIPTEIRHLVILLANDPKRVREL